MNKKYKLRVSKNFGISYQTIMEDDVLVHIDKRAKEIELEGVDRWYIQFKSNIIMIGTHQKNFILNAIKNKDNGLILTDDESCIFFLNKEEIATMGTEAFLKTKGVSEEEIATMNKKLKDMGIC